MLSIGRGILSFTHRRGSHEVTCPENWRKTSSTLYPQKLALVLTSLQFAWSVYANSRLIPFSFPPVLLMTYFSKVFLVCCYFFQELELGTYNIIQCWLLHLLFLPYLMPELTAACESEGGFMRSINISDRIFISFPPSNKT